MKKLLSSVLMFSFLSVAVPAKKAEAGFMILGATQEFVWDSKYEWIDNVLVFALPITLITTSIFAVGIAGNPFNNFTLIAGAVCLDENIEGKRGEIIASLQNRYPFLDNQEVVNQLTNKIIKRYSEQKDKNGSALVEFTQNEVDQVSDALDLDNNQRIDLQTLK